MAYTKYSLTPANNTAAPPDGAPEGMLPSAVNDTMRDMMSQIRDVGDGVRDGTYTMTAPKITGGTITGVVLTGNTLTNPVITGATLTTSAFNGTVGATTASTGAFTTLSTSSTTTLSGLTASTALALDVSKNVVSVTNTGTGNNVLSASPTLTGTIAGASLSLSSLTSGRVTYATTAGLLTDSANLLYSGTDLTVYGLTVGRGGGAISTNTAVGSGSLFTNSSGSSNASFGYNALYTNGIGAFNSGFGQEALFSNSSGYSNSAFGYYALRLTTGQYNTAVGAEALQANTTASNNTAVGYQAGYSNTTGSLTTVGYLAGYSNSTGTDNSSFGSFSLRYTTTGAGNSGYGAYSLTNNTTGSSNTAVGMQALQANTTASNNTAVGYQAGYSATSGGYNTFIGQTAGYSTTGAGNTFVGGTASSVGAGYFVTSGQYNTILGGYHGNQGGLDIRTASNYIVLSDGQGNPRGIFDGSGNFLVGKTVNDTTTNGCNISASGRGSFSSNGQAVGDYNRTGDDGVLVNFLQDGTIEGTISVSGSTVSYNGGHLSRWSQWQNQSGQPNVYRGTVLESTNDMCQWNQANEQSTKTIVSNTEKAKTVAGVFDMYDFDDKANPNDFYVAQSGDFVIRISQGVVVQNGDLLESAGDGTARPQTDDICRSSTIAKVTSNYVSTTYADGSFCVPCILMIG